MGMPPELMAQLQASMGGGAGMPQATPIPAQPEAPIPPAPETMPVQPDGQDVIEPDPELRGNVIDWNGGKPINLAQTMSSGKTLEEELSQHISENLEQELKNHDQLVKKLEKWHGLYRAERKAARPQPWMADVSIPIIRSDSDAIYVREIDALFNKRRIVLMKPIGDVSPERRDMIYKWEKALNNYLQKDLNLKEKMKFPLRQSVNTGTGVVKIVYETKNRSVYRYADKRERASETVTKYKALGTDSPLVKEEAVIFRGPNVYPVDRGDFIISSDALTIDDAYLVGFRFTRRKKQLQEFVKAEIYRKEAVDKMMPDKPTPLAEARAASAGQALDKTTYTEPYELWELWLKYDCDDDGEEDDIVVTFHKESKQIVKAIYNPIFYGYRPFVDVKSASQTEYTYDGEGVCELLEGISEEIDTLHNLLLDRMKLINLPMIFYNSGSFVKDLKFEPGTCKPVDGIPQDAIMVVQLPDVTFSISNEINWLISQADRVVGVTPGVLGVSTTERPVAKDTQALNEEANKKFKQHWDNARAAIVEMVYRILECFAQHQPTYTYTDENGQTTVVKMPIGNIREQLEISLEASTEAMNMDARREVELMRYQALSDYLTKQMGMVQLVVNPQVPSGAKKYAFQANDVGARALTRFLSNFEDPEPESSVVDMRKTLSEEECIKNSVDLLQPQQQAAEQQQAEANAKKTEEANATEGMLLSKQPWSPGGEEVPFA